MTLGSHQKTVGASQVHITPFFIIDALGPFDLDPCAAFPRPWNCASTSISLPSDGLASKWEGFVWCNPPFNRYGIAEWIGRMVQHDNGILLLHARTETAWFQPVWKHATILLFLGRRLTFHKPDGSLCTTKAGEPANSGAPIVLVGFGATARSRLSASGLEGAYVTNWYLKEKK